MISKFNQKAYLKRIKYSGSIEPTIEVLTNLHTHHLLHIPFENLDIHYNNPITLNPEIFFHKIVTNSRGGFCYELNGLYFELLKSIGFEVELISAKVFRKEEEYANEFGHLTLIVTIYGDQYLTDIGFGDFSFKPLKIELGVIQNDSQREFIFDQYDNNYLRINTIVNGQKTPSYIFKNQHRPLSDFEEMCKFHQTSSESHFTHKKVITIPTSDGRITLSSNELKIHKNGSTTTLKVKDQKEFEQLLWNYFKIKMS